MGIVGYSCNIGCPFSYYHKPKQSVVRKLFWLWLLISWAFPEQAPSLHRWSLWRWSLPGFVQEVEGKPYFFHHVKQGQTLYSIARAYAVSQEVIVAENPDVAFGLRLTR
jgi:hypothetical protein